MKLTPNQIKVLKAAKAGNAMLADIESRRAKTRAVKDMKAARFVYGGYDGGTLTPAGRAALAGAIGKESGQ